MRGCYRDIINLPHRVSYSREKMSRHSRAAQFAPFAALTGYDAAIRESARLTEDEIYLDEDKCAEINSRLITALNSDVALVEIIYFVPDTRKCGGAVFTSRGRIADIDPILGQIKMDGGKKIPLSAVLDVKGDFCG